MDFKRKIPTALETSKNCLEIRNDTIAPTTADSRNTDETDVEHAIVQAGFGRYNIEVAIFCILLYMNMAVGLTSISFILPSAACDLKLTTLDKGRIGSTATLGMLAGSYFWGCFAEVHGRRLTLLFALFAYAAMENISAFVTNWWIFLLLKFFSGWAITGQSTLVFTYLGEFLANDVRAKILSWMEMAWTAGLITLPLLGWAVIPLEFHLTIGPLEFHSWKLFIVVCALPSLLIGIWLIYLPETPKHLAEIRQDEKLARVLEDMYRRNTGGSFDEYLDKLSKNGHERLRLRLSAARCLTVTEKICDLENPKEKNSSPSSTSGSQIFWKMLCSLCSQTSRLCKPPYLRSTFIVCGLMYFACSTYYSLVLWLPEVFQRFAAFEKLQPNETTSVCKISTVNRTIILQQEDDCSGTVHNDVYLHTLILGLSCIPISILLPLCVHKVGYKFYLVISTTAAGIATVGLFFVESSTQNLILSCLFESFTSVCLSIILCLVVDLYPTDLRAMAAALCIFFGRIGALLGNTLFGYLIDDYCIPLISVIAAQLFLSTALGLLIPSAKSNFHGS